MIVKMLVILTSGTEIGCDQIIFEADTTLRLYNGKDVIKVQSVDVERIKMSMRET